MNKTIGFKWRSFTCPGLLILLGFGFSLIPLAKREIFFYWDNAQQFYPLAVYLHDALRLGKIPQWWFQVGSGIPILAEGQAAHFYPFRLLFDLVFSPPAAFMLEIGLHFGLMGLGTYLFLRQFRLRKEACLVGSLCQMFGSCSVVFVKNIPFFRTYSLLPLAMLMAERFVTRKKISYGFAMSGILGLQFLAGFQTLAIMTIVATSFYILFRVLHRSWHVRESFRFAARQVGHAIVWWGLAVVLGLGIAGIQLLPQFLHIDKSIRQGGLNFHYALTGLTANIKCLPQLFFPYVYNQGDWLNELSQWGSYFNAVPYEGLYIGVFPVLFGFLGLWWYRRWPDPGWPLLLCCLVATGFAFGSKTPLYPALWSLPGMQGLRYPSRFLLWTSFCLSCLAALGLHRLIALSRLNLARMRVLVPFLLLAGWIIFLALFFWTQGTMLARIVNTAPDFRSGIIISLILYIIAFSLALALLVTPRPYQRFVLVMVVLLVFTDLWIFRFRSSYAPAVSMQQMMTPPPVVEFIKTDRDQFRVMSLIPWEKGLNRNADLIEFLQPYTPTIWGVEPSGDYASLMLKRYYAIHDSIIWELLNSSQAAEKLTGFLGFLNVKYVVTPKKSVVYSGWEKVFETTRAVVWKNPSFLPRAFLVGKIVPETIEVREEWSDISIKRLARYHYMVGNWWTRRKDAEIVDNIMSGTLNFRTTAVVEGLDASKLSGADPVFEIYSSSQQTNVMKFDVKTSKAALLVVSNNYYPGWTAMVNKQPADIFRTNYVGMGVLVSAGQNEVVFQFTTPGFRVGYWVTIISILILLSGLIVSRRTNKPGLNLTDNSLKAHGGIL